MQKPVRLLFILFAALFVAIVAQLTYVQVVRAPAYNTHPANTRTIEAQRKIERGVIVSADGEELATNKKNGPYFDRVYPLGSLVQPWMGYVSTRFGRAGLERAYNPELTGELDELTVRNWLDVITGKPKRGADLRLTLDTRVQRAAAEALGNRTGAVVALNPRTGGILAMVSAPRFNAADLESQWESLSSSPSRPLLNRALSGLYPPGSSFKPIVAAGALQEGIVTPASPFDDSGSYIAGGYRVRNFGGEVYGSHDFETALIDSINTTFAKVGVSMGAGTLARYADAFGFEKAVPWRLGGSASRFPDPGAMDVAHVAQASFGQGEVLATPLQMALLAAGIANDGRIMKPFLVEEVRDYQQTVLQKTQPELWLQAVDAATAATVRDMMVGVVREGTGTRAAIPGVQVAGKTGTAELDSGEPHAWFIGFAPADNPQIAVAVLVERAGTGGRVAAPIAKTVMQAGLAR